MTQSESEISIRPVSMAHEMYNDGLYFVEQSKKLEYFGDKQRCYRFAVISFASSFESFINAQIRNLLNNKPNKSEKEEAILNFLENGFTPGSDFPIELSKVTGKLNILEGLSQTNESLVNTDEFKKFNVQIIRLRNAIVHYSHGNFTQAYEEQIFKAAESGAQLLRNVIKMFERKLNLLEYSYFDKVYYEPIK